MLLIEYLWVNEFKISLTKRFQYKSSSIKLMKLAPMKQLQKVLTGHCTCTCIHENLYLHMLFTVILFLSGEVLSTQLCSRLNMPLVIHLNWPPLSHPPIIYLNVETSNRLSFKLEACLLQHSIWSSFRPQITPIKVQRSCKYFPFQPITLV